MRKVAVLLFATAMVLPIPFSAAPAGAAGGTTCKQLRGIETWKPPLLKRNDARKTRPTIKIKNAKLSGCTTGGVKSGKVSASIKWLDPGNCDALLGYTPGEDVPRIKGSVTIAWNTGESSTAKVSLNKTKPYVQIVKGTVSAGKFKGLKFNVMLLIAPRNGGCVERHMTAASFSRLTKLVIK